MTMTLEQLHDWITRLPEPFQPARRQTDAIEAAIRERDRLRGDVDGLRDCAERAEAELAGVRETIKCLNHRVQVAGAAQAQTAYFIGGPHATAIVHDLHHADRVIEALCECTGDDEDDYTVTDLSTAS